MLCNSLIGLSTMGRAGASQVSIALRLLNEVRLVGADHRVRHATQHILREATIRSEIKTLDPTPQLLQQCAEIHFPRQECHTG